MQITKFSHLVYYYIYVEHMQNYMSIYMHIYSKNMYLKTFISKTFISKTFKGQVFGKVPNA